MTDNVIKGRFNGRIRKLLGFRQRSAIYIDEATIVQILLKSELFGNWAKLHNDCQVYKIQYYIENNDLIGIGFEVGDEEE